MSPQEVRSITKPKCLEDAWVGLQWSSHPRKSPLPGKKQGVPCWFISTLILEIHSKGFSIIKIIWWPRIWSVRPFEESIPINLIPKSKLSFRNSFQYLGIRKQSTGVTLCSMSGKKYTCSDRQTFPCTPSFILLAISGKASTVPWKTYRLGATSLHFVTWNDANLVSF